MMSFYPWRVHSICGNLNDLSNRVNHFEVPIPRISWGRSMEYNCKLLLTILRQNELQISKDLPGWINRRIECCRELETIMSIESGSWVLAIERIRVKLQSPVTEPAQQSPLVMRAYMETSRLQNSTREPYPSATKTARDFTQKAEWEVRRIRKGYRHAWNRKPVSKWELSITLSIRKMRMAMVHWDRIIKNQCKSINQRGPQNESKQKEWHTR